MKNARQAEIMNIIQNTRVETQEQLLEELRDVYKRQAPFWPG